MKPHPVEKSDLDALKKNVNFDQLLQLIQVIKDEQLVIALGNCHSKDYALLIGGAGESKKQFQFWWSQEDGNHADGGHWEVSLVKC